MLIWHVEFSSSHSVSSSNKPSPSVTQYLCACPSNRSSREARGGGGSGGGEGWGQRSPPRRVVVACPRGGRPERGLPVPTSAHPRACAAKFRESSAAGDCCAIAIDDAFKVVSARCTHEARPHCLQPLEGIAPVSGRSRLISRHVSRRRAKRRGAPEETANGVRRDQRDGIEPERGRLRGAGAQCRKRGALPRCE